MKKEHMNLNYRAVPVFADRTITASQVASRPQKENKKKAEKIEGTIRLIFVDSVTQSSVADVVMTTIAAEQLITGIRQSIDNINKQVKGGKMPIQPAEPVPENHQPYIG